MIRVIVFLTSLLLAAPVSAERVNLNIRLYGLNTDANWSFDTLVLAGIDMLDRPPAFTQKPNSNIIYDRRKSYIELRLENIFVERTSPSVLISMTSYRDPTSDSKGVKLYFPLMYIELDDVQNGQNILIDRPLFRGKTEYLRAVKAGFPFYDSNERVRISSDNIIAALNAAREVIRRGEEPSDEVWDTIFLLFQTNAQLMTRNEKVLKEIVSVLKDYSNSNQTPEFARFYLTFLEKMILADLGKTLYLEDQVLANDYLMNEVMTQFARNPKVGVFRMNELLAAFNGNKDYTRCLTVATSAQKSLRKSIGQDPENLRSIGSRNLAEQMDAGLVVGTECAQRFYTDSDPNGSRGDIVNGAKFVANHEDLGQGYAKSFVDLTTALSESDLMKIDHAEVKKFDLFYTEHINAIFGAD